MILRAARSVHRRLLNTGSPGTPHSHLSGSTIARNEPSEFPLSENKFHADLKVSGRSCARYIPEGWVSIPRGAILDVVIGTTELTPLRMVPSVKELKSELHGKLFADLYSLVQTRVPVIEPCVPKGIPSAITHGV